MAFLDSIKEEIRSSTLDRAKNSYHDGEEVTDFTLLGNDPGRGRRPVEWGEIPSVRLLQLYVWRGYEAL